MLSRTFRTFAMAIILLLYFVCATFIWLTSGNSWKTKKRLTRLVQLSCHLALRIINVKVNSKFIQQGPPSNYFIVANHVSYVDILALASLFPACFVTSQEMKETPLLGQICYLAGCLFVERRSRANLINEIAEITNALKNGLNVMVFPEATSTNGNEVIRFRRPLFNAAIQSETPVLPITLKYQTLAGKPISTENRDFIFWYDDTGFITHFWRFLKYLPVELEVIISPTISVSSQTDVASLSEAAHDEVAKHYSKLSQLPSKVEKASINYNSPILN